MLKLLELINKAWAENHLGKFWNFSFNGKKNTLNISIDQKIIRKPAQNGTFFLDRKESIDAACKFISDNLNN